MANKTKKILIVEDEPFTIKLYTHRLEGEGYEVTATTQATEALRLAKEKKPDLFIVDLMLENGNGFDVIKKLRNTTGFKKTPIITLSNLGQETDVNNAIKNGANKYFVKSNTSFQKIIDTVKSFLD